MELFRALAVLAEPPRAETARVAGALGLGPVPAADEYTGLFVFQLYPYASIYLGAEGMLGGEARDRVAGFWRALGQVPPAEADHLSVMLAFYARLVDFEVGAAEESRRAGWRGARKAFLWEHLLSWLPCFLHRLADLAPPFYRAWGEIFREALAEEAKTVGTQADLPLALREAPRVIDPRSGTVEDFLSSLLAPARSGIILTRADLSRAARRLGLASRAGERRFILETLCGQNAEGMFGWLSEEASAWAERHEKDRGCFGEVARWWERRARATSALLRELRAAAAGPRTNSRSGGEPWKS